MNTKKKLLRSDIRYECGDSAYEQGRSYAEHNQVVALVVRQEAGHWTQLTATVDGGANQLHQQNIRILWNADFSAAQIRGNCSCKEAYNCKHVAAACLHYQSTKQTKAQTTDLECLEWLDNLNKPLTKTHDIYKDFLVYILKAGSTPYNCTVEFMITKALKTGRLSKARKINFNTLRYGYSYTSHSNPLDEEIEKLIFALGTHKGEPLLSGAIGSIALAKLVQTGRLFWESIDNPVISLGAPRNLAFSWQQENTADYHLSISVQSAAKLLLTDPPQYLDTVLGTLGKFNAPIPNTETLAKILAIPHIPAEHADEFSFKLTVEHPELHLPAPRQIELSEQDGLTPIPHLTLLGLQRPLQPYAHVLALSFDYGGWTLPATSTDTEYSTVKAESGYVRIQRAPDTERLALHLLAQLGFTPTADPANPYGLLLASNDYNQHPHISNWQHFVEYSLADLAQTGWLIDILDSFKLNFQYAESFAADIGESQNDWFEMQFNVDIDGKAYPLLPLIMPILETYDPENLPDTLNLYLGDHSYLSIASDKIQPIIAVLLELFNTSQINPDGTLKLSRFNAASLADLETHSYGLFSLNGGQQLRALGQQLKNFAGIQSVALPDNFYAELRPYQQQGLNWLQFLREYQFGGILADDMGLGKTVQTLAHLLLEKQSGRMTQPCLIIAPTSLMSNWRREAARFTPGLTVLILQGAERKQLFAKINDYDLVLTTYPLLPRDEETLLKHDYHYLVLDEAQTIKNPASLASQVVRRINAKHRLCLTGTPMENHLGELWAQFDFLMPGFLGNSAHFKKNYRTPIEMFGETGKKLRLSQRLAPFMLRRTKHDVASELPPKTEILRTVPLYPKQAALYESIRLTMEKRVRDAIAEKGLAGSHITILDALLKLRQTCCDPRTLALKEAQKVTASAKLDLLMALLPEQLEEGRRILVFSQFTRMIALIETELNARHIPYSKLTGQTRKRDEAIERFKSGAANVFLISLKAGGVGLNLTEADTVIIYDPWWNPAAESQAADRAHRIGQDKPVFVYKLITENTVEEKIIAMQDRKRALADSIYKDNDKEQPLSLTADDLTALFEPL
ncbi:MAG: DEAD/DEAH box helicase [Methylococcaceae bacterium]|nr:DEAD/DEAH box helicase [Methylococcaceae bacterium]